MNLPRFSVNQPVFIHLVFLFILVFGLMSYHDLPRAKNPDVSLNMAFVITNDFAKSPKEIEKFITIPIEDELEQLSDVRQILSTSGEGISTIFVEWEPTVKDLDIAVQDLRNAVNQAQDIPDSAETPIIFKITTEIEPALFVVLGGDMTHEQLKLHADALSDQIKRIDEVGKIEMYGEREQEIHVELDPLRLNSHGLSPLDVVQAIRLRHRNVSAGPIRVGGKEELIRIEGEVENMRELEDLVILTRPDGSVVRLGEVGTVSMGYGEAALFTTKLDGEPALVLSVHRRKQGNVVKVVDEVKALVERLRQRAPETLRLATVYDTAREIHDRLRILISNGLIGMALVGGLLYLFIGWRNALFAFLGIPVTFLLAFIFMRASGNTINGISLFALIIVIGMIVDDAIIILENTYRYVEKGMPPKQAAVIGATEVALPVTAAVATTIAAFVPMLMLTGLMGRFFRVIPMTIIAALAASLFEAFFILPCHIGEFGRLAARETARLRARADRRSRLIQAIRRRYRRIAATCLRWRYLTIAVAVLVVMGSLALLLTPLIKVELFGATDERERFQIMIWRSVGTRVEETEKTLEVIDRIVRDELGDEVVTVLQFVGYSEVEYRMIRASHVGMVAVTLTRGWRNLDETMERLRPHIAQLPEIVKFQIDKPVEGPPVGADVDLQVTGRDFATIETIVGLIEAELASMEGVSEIRNNYERGKNEITVRPDEEKSQFLGVNVETLAATIYAAFEGATVADYHRGDEKIEILVRAKEAFRHTFNDLRNLKIPAGGGRLVPLNEIARFEVQPGVFEIHHYDGRRAIQVMADVGKGSSPVEVTAKLQPVVDNILGNFPGYSVKFGGEAQETKEAYAEFLTAFGFGVLLIYIILATQFKSFVQPVMIMAIIPAAAFGVVFGLLVSKVVTGHAVFSIPVMVAVIALAGVVVNDSLVLVDFINRRRRAGTGRWSSILQGCMIRVRPIILTSVTTIGGLLPMALGVSGRSRVWGPLAGAIAWGLLFSTVLTLIVIPCIYAIFDDVRLLVLRRFFGQARRPHERLPLDRRE